MHETCCSCTNSAKDMQAGPPTGDPHLDCADVAAARGAQQRRLQLHVGDVRVCAPCQQRGHHRHVAGAGGLVQGCVAAQIHCAGQLFQICRSRQSC